MAIFKIRDLRKNTIRKQRIIVYAYLEPATHFTPVTSSKYYSVEIFFTIVFELDTGGRCVVEIWNDLPLKNLMKNLHWLRIPAQRMLSIYLNLALSYIGNRAVVQHWGFAGLTLQLKRSFHGPGYPERCSVA